MEEWKEYKLIDVCSRLKSGKGIKSDLIFDKGLYPVIGGNGLRGYTDKSNFQGECGVIGRQGAYCGNVRYFEGESYMTEHAIIVVGNDYADTYYLTCLLSLMHLGNLSAQSAQPGISVQTLSKQIVNLPSILYQKKVSKILKSLDDKIEVNRRINEQLEELAQALFKSWFVDFEPFKDGEFVESELGMIPEGWKVGELSEIGDVVGGATPSKSNEDYYTENGISWITPKDLSINKNKFIEKGETDITELGYSKCSAKLMPRGSILFSSRAPIGYIAIAKKELCTNQGFKSVVPKYAGTSFVYFYLKNNVSNIESMASGSTFKEASGALMKSLKVIIPPSSLLQEYEEKASSIFNKQENLEEEITYLTNLRDTLLPKLMSGEIDVNEVEI